MSVPDLEQKLMKELTSVTAELAKLQSRIALLLDRQTKLVERKQSLEKDLQSSIEGKLHRQNWNSDDFEWSGRLHEVLWSTFRLNKYRELQKESINVTMSGLDCLLVMPTGGGKSLCYQLPAAASAGSGITLVVSPLVSLMEDQVMALKKLGVPAEMLNASSSREHVNSVQSSLVTPSSSLCLLYVTPEKLAKSKRFMSKLEKCHDQKRLLRIAIDEVHCCSHWGHDFRPDYKFLGVLKRQFPGVPILGLTATATSKVLDDLKDILNIQHAITFRAPYNRPNLFYEVRLKPTNHAQCISEVAELILVRFKGMSGIIYCLSRKDAETVAADLCNLSVRATHYHADASPEHRSRVHHQWLQNTVQVIVATIAFGMGIDKPDVRFVIHHSLSKSMENYYQESGRAGRDDKEAHCILYYRLGDLFRQSCMVFAERTGLAKLYDMMAYCHNPDSRCRRKIIARQFSEAWESSQCKDMCDCCRSQVDVVTKDLNPFCSQLHDILDVAHSKDQRLTALKLTDLWLDDQQKARKQKKAEAKRGSTANTNDCVVSSREECERALAHLLLHGYLKEDFHFTPYSTISYLVKGTDPGSASIVLPVACSIRFVESSCTAAVADAGNAGEPCAVTKEKRSSLTVGSSRKKAKLQVTPTDRETSTACTGSELIDISMDSSEDEDVYVVSMEPN